MKVENPPAGHAGQRGAHPGQERADGEPVVLAVDPGEGKCGLAVCAPGRVLYRNVVPRHAVLAVARDLAHQFGATAVVVGDATGSWGVRRDLLALGLPVHAVPEAETTLAARELYFHEHPPRGFWRLVPRGLRIPPEPYDDYVAVLLAERFLRNVAWG